jgi:hypothetical protein
MCPGTPRYGSPPRPHGSQPAPGQVSDLCCIG